MAAVAAARPAGRRSSCLNWKSSRGSCTTARSVPCPSEGRSQVGPVRLPQIPAELRTSNGWGSLAVSGLDARAGGTAGGHAPRPHQGYSLRAHSQ